MFSVPFVPDTVNVFGVDVPTFALAVFFGAGLLAVCVFCCCSKHCGSEDPPTSESFKWPSSSRFLKMVDPRNPPKLFVNRYEDPIRTDVLVLDEEANWIVTYQPSGGRHEIVQHMYLRFREGAVYGVGFEEGRKACKISGKYKRNEGANQMAVVMTCRFSNDVDTVMFHGSGNGTGLVGNCYIRELDRFSSFSQILTTPTEHGRDQIQGIVPDAQDGGHGRHSYTRSASH
ncbi:unnamed protein product [Ectocarpus sp. CCAP 1310/34]|nr:unnamed protein product [Ectocarpus sp. CCAP 1310/34]